MYVQGAFGNISIYVFSILLFPKTEKEQKFVCVRQLIFLFLGIDLGIDLEQEKKVKKKITFCPREQKEKQAQRNLT